MLWWRKVWKANIPQELRDQFELFGAATTEDESERARQMTFILVGAGPTGVELAGSVAHMVKVTLRGTFDERRCSRGRRRFPGRSLMKRLLPTPTSV
jgi:NADH:ubiquinone reductase (H+-translocating)